MEDGADSGGGGSGATARKPGQRRNTRVVSHLEPERLQRKRQVDRKAQQALRERAKSRVRALEGEVAGLQQALEQRERQHVAQVAALQEQTTWLRDTLDRIAQLTRGRLEDVSTRPAPHSPGACMLPPSPPSAPHRLAKRDAFALASSAG